MPDTPSSDVLELVAALRDRANCAEDACQADGDDHVYRRGFEQLRYAAATIERLSAELEQAKALVSEQSIERLAEDIAIACVDCRQEIKEARHRAMVRLGDRLRNPVPNDLKRLAALTHAPRQDVEQPSAPGAETDV